MLNDWLVTIDNGECEVSLPVLASTRRDAIATAKSDRSGGVIVAVRQCDCLDCVREGHHSW